MKARVLVVRNPRIISPFQERASEMWFSGETIAEAQRRAFAQAGCTVETIGVDELAGKVQGDRPTIVTLDSIYVSEKAAADFLKACRGRTSPAALGFTDNASVDYTRPLQSLGTSGDLHVHAVIYLPPGSATAPSGDNAEEVVRGWANRVEAIEVEKREIVHDIPLPTLKRGERATLRYPITSTVVVSIEHWVHVLWLNQIAFGIRWVELLRRKWLWGVGKALGALSLDPRRLLDRLVRKGRGVKVHPSAYVSGSILGDNVQVGAHVTLKNCIVRPGAVIQDHAVLLNCVIGEHTLILENTFMVSSVVLPEATVGNYKLQVSLIGRGAHVNVWASFIDARFAGSIKVMKDGLLQSTERSFLGSVVGHRARLGAKMLLHSGREIPNDTVVVMRPDEIVSEVPADLPQGVPLVRHQGRLVPLGEES